MIIYIFCGLVLMTLIAGSYIVDLLSPGPKQGLWGIILLSSVMYTIIPYLIGIVLINWISVKWQYKFIFLYVPMIFILSRICEIIYFNLFR
jgi:hypothetical protein